MAGHGFKDRSVAERLKQMAGVTPTSQRDGQHVSRKINFPITENELIFLAPSTGIPARNGDTLYSAICCVFDCVEDTTSDEVEISLTCKYRRVYNDTDEDIEPYTVFVGKLRKYGQFYHEKTLYVERTTTTTVYQDVIGPSCFGTCKWVWSASTQEWVNTLNTCAATTTTTTTDPYTTSTTTTTPCPCEEGLEPSSPTTTTTTTTVYDPTSTTTSTTTTTTTTQSCNCSYPDFCGTASGQCVYTNCIPSYYENNPPYCSSTTSTTTTTTTSACDCGTTTTQAGCSYGCDWYWGLDGSWHLSVDGCSSDCPCPRPDYTGSSCSGAHTNCIGTTTTTTPLPSCDGQCVWYWHSYTNQWYLNENGCAWSVTPGWAGINSCSCPKPTHSGTVCGQSTTTNCSVNADLTSTTTTTTTTLGECWQCYTSSTSSTTTTTPDGCDAGRCSWQWGGSSWTKTFDSCPYSCTCLEPGFSGQDACEITWTYCVGPPTTTTTTTTTTSTTSTTSTTCPVSGCMYACSASGWIAVCDCVDPEICDPCFTEPCMESIYGTIVVCGCQTTTTTTSTTTTTTTTCGYCSWGAPYLGTWNIIYNGCTGSCGGCYPPTSYIGYPDYCHAPGGCGGNTNCETTTTSTTTTTTPSGNCWEGICWFTCIDGSWVESVSCGSGCYCSAGGSEFEPCEEGVDPDIQGACAGL